MSALETFSCSVTTQLVNNLNIQWVATRNAEFSKRLDAIDTDGNADAIGKENYLEPLTRITQEMRNYPILQFQYKLEMIKKTDIGWMQWHSRRTGGNTVLDSINQAWKSWLWSAILSY